MYPAWAMEEYASIRFTLSWSRADRFPTVMVRNARTHRMFVIAGPSAGKVSSVTRSSAAKAAAFTPAAMNAVTTVGAPWYASGVHMWKGTSDTLKANPTRSSPTPTVNTGFPKRRRSPIIPAIAGIFVVPVTEYIRAIP